MAFALFFLAEYCNIIIVCALWVTYFFGAWLPFFSFFDMIIPGIFWFAFKVCCLCFIFIFIRGTLPRYRYDQLMLLCWKVYLPLTFSYLFFVVAFVTYFGLFPDNNVVSFITQEDYYSTLYPIFDQPLAVYNEIIYNFGYY
jgi:NADH-quinone oxidoreductase subunit H